MMHYLRNLTILNLLYYTVVYPKNSLSEYDNKIAALDANWPETYTALE